MSDQDESNTSTGNRERQKHTFRRKSAKTQLQENKYMKSVVVGSGGREHALAHVLGRDSDVTVTPGNPGIPNSTNQFSIKVVR